MASGPDNFDTFFAPGGDPSGPTRGEPAKKGSPPPRDDTETPRDIPVRETRENYDPSESDWGTPTIGDSPPPTAKQPSAQILAVGEKLVQLQIVTQEQWEAGLARASDVTNLRSILDALREIPSHRRARGESQIPAVSDYQAKLILQGQAKRLRLGPYLIQDRIGAGGMGEVFRGWNLDLDRIEAIKTITRDDVTGSTMGLARFDREARVLAQLTHPCITTIYSTGREDGVAYIAMQYIRGRTLVQVVKDAAGKGEDVPVEWAVDAMREVASALEHAHGSGVIHRDIKPNNIMITNDGEVRVLDMGIARLVDPSSKNAPGLTRQVAGMGTPEVMPPEQWADASSVSPASDIYSLGCTFFYLLTGKMPFVGGDLHTLMAAHLTTPPPDVCEVRPDVPRTISEILKRMMAKEASDRFASCAELIAAIDEYKATTAHVEPPPPSLPWAWFAAAAALAILVAAFGWYIGRDRRDYRKEGEQFLEQWQRDHAEQWGTPDELKTAVESSPYKSFATAAGLAGMQQWVQQQTKARFDEEFKFKEFLVDYRAQHTDVWPTAAALNAFLAPLRDTHSREEIKALVEKETAERDSLRKQAIQQVADALASAPEIWKSKEEIEQAANSACPLESVMRPEMLDRRRKAIEEAARERWQAKIEAALREYQKSQVDAWKSPEILLAWARGKMPFESVATIKDYNRLLGLIERETWERKSLDWVLKYRAGHSTTWKGDDDIVGFVQKKYPDGVSDERATTAMQSAVKEETVARMKQLANRWAKDYAAKNSGVWPEPAALVEAIYAKADWEEMASDSSGPTDFTKRANDASYRRVFEPSLPKTGDPAADYQRAALLRLVGWLLSIQASGVAAEKLDLSVEVEGEPVKTIPLTAKPVFGMETPVAGYATLVVLESSGKVFVFQWNQALSAKSSRKLLKLSAEAAGTDRMILFVTEHNPWQSLPQPPRELGIRPAAVEDTEYLQQLVVPPIGQTEADLEILRKALPTHQLLDGLLEMLWVGKSPDYIPPAANVKQWGRTAEKVKYGD